MKYSVTKNSLPPANFSFTLQELESKILALEVAVESYHHMLISTMNTVTMLGNLVLSEKYKNDE